VSFSSAREEDIECKTLCVYVFCVCFYLHIYVYVYRCHSAARVGSKILCFGGGPSSRLTNQVLCMYIHIWHKHTQVQTHRHSNTHRHTRTDTDIDTDTDTDRHARAFLFVLCNSSWKYNRILVIGIYDNDPSSWNYTQNHTMYTRRKETCVCVWDKDPMTGILYNFDIKSQGIRTTKSHTEFYDKDPI